MTHGETLDIVSSRHFPVPRARLYAAFADPDQLSRWWGPHGFTNTMHRFELVKDGTWHFTMTSSDGDDFVNTSTFLEVTPSERITFLHHEPVHVFTMTMTYDEEADGTRLTWRMQFEPTDANKALARFLAAANEQNFDRLEAVLAEEETTRDA